MKKPKWAEIPAVGKTPKVLVDVDWRSQPIRWSFALFDGVAPGTCNHHSGDQFIDVGKHLKSTEQRTWKDIEANHKRDHSIPIDQLIPLARKRLAELKQDDIDVLWRLRFNGKQRLWGIREGRYFRVIWWDPLHAVCPSSLKHT